MGGAKLQISIACIILVFGGWIVTGLVVKLMSLSIGLEKDCFRRLDLWIGGTERLVTLVFTVFAPKLLIGFIGGWTVIKFASSWHKNDQSMVGLFLIGNTVSFGLAVSVGGYFNQSILSDL